MNNIVLKLIFWASFFIVILTSCVNSPSGSQSESSTAAAYIAPSVHSNPWSFGVMADSQWYGADDGNNPGSVAVGIINYVNREFIEKNVKLAIAVGDLADNLPEDYFSNSATNYILTNYPENIDVRAAYAQDLYNAGIAFYPVRGNHDDFSNEAAEFVRVFPQTSDGINNNTPSDVLADTGILTDTFISAAPVKSGGAFTAGSGFSSPSSDLKGLSYEFDYNNARFIVIDQFTRPDGTVIPETGCIDDQLNWIYSSVSGRPAGTHAFIFSHKGIIMENHIDGLFGTNENIDDLAAQNAFIACLSNNGVRYLIEGHDHIHQRSIIKSPDGASQVWNITSSSCSSKFYNPVNKSSREISISQETNTIGYYIYTVDGPFVNVDFYSYDPHPKYKDYEWIITNMDGLDFKFTKRESFGYSLNGKEFLVPEGSNYNIVSDSFSNTAMSILDGINGSSLKDGQGRKLVKAVDTGWVAGNGTAYSDIVRIWGMSDIGTNQTDKYVISISYNASGLSLGQLFGGHFGIAALNGNSWTNAADLNFSSSSKTFVAGAYNPSLNYKTGTFGINTNNNTAWAVIDYNGYFVVTTF